MRTSGNEGGYRPHRPRGASGPSRPRRSNPLLGLDLGEDEQRYIEDGEKPRRRSAVKPSVAGRKYTVGQVLLFVALGGVLLATAGLVVLNLRFPNWPHRNSLPPPTVLAAPRPPAPRSAAPAPRSVPHATSPIEAVKLMLRTSAQGDTRAAYAQWDIQPEDIATVERGVQITLADQTEEMAARGARMKLENYRYRLGEQSSAEARVSQYRGDVLTQVYSLRRVGPYWKIYNAHGPER